MHERQHSLFSHKDWKGPPASSVYTGGLHPMSGCSLTLTCLGKSQDVSHGLPSFHVESCQGKNKDSEAEGDKDGKTSWVGRSKASKKTRLGGHWMEVREGKAWQAASCQLRIKISPPAVGGGEQEQPEHIPPPTLTSSQEPFAARLSWEKLG